MEEVRSSIEKIFDSYEASNRLDKNVKNLDYSFLSNKGDEMSSPSGPAAKRKRDDNDSSLNVSTSSFNSTFNGSSNQWEVRILKADLIEANAKVQQLKKEIDERVRLHSNLEQLYEGRLKNLQNETDRSIEKNTEYEKILKHLRKHSANDKSEIVRLKNEIEKQRQSYKELISSLKVQNRDLETANRETLHRCNTEISSLSLRLEENQTQINAMNEELITLRARNEELSAKCKDVDKLSGELDLERYNLSAAQRKIQELETDLANYGEWKNLSKVFQQRLAKVTDLERECERLTRDNKNLHETIGNKLLLEEQVHDLKTRLESKQRTTETQLDLETKLNVCEQELKDWKKIVKDYCVQNSSITPHTLRSYIDDIQKKHLILTSDAGSANLEKSSFNNKIFELRKSNEFLQKTNENLSTNFTNYKNALHRLQKKLTLVARERDCFKNLLENYEKDLTISAAHMDHHQDNELKTRLDLVEKSLSGYKEICETLEKELEMARSTGGDNNIPTINEENEYFKKELNKLRIENERLNRRKSELELLIAQANMKEAYKMDEKEERELKVIHLQNNPADEAYENHKNEVDKLRAEIERLKRKMRKMEEEHDDLTTRLNETTNANTTVNIQEVGVLRAQIQSLESKQQHYKEIYRAASLEFREVIYLLFGYRVDRVGNNNYRISSVYADNEDEYLNFRLNEMGELDMLETDYSLTLDEMVNNFLAKHHSMPAFLSSLTLELFNRTTVAVN